MYIILLYMYMLHAHASELKYIYNSCPWIHEMTEFTAEEKYRAFESLRSRFGGSGGSGKTGLDQDYRAQQQIKSKRRAGTRPDPRSNAPPLVPLVEEGDAVSLQQLEGRGWSLQQTAVKGVGLLCWVFYRSLFVLKFRTLMTDLWWRECGNTAA